MSLRDTLEAVRRNRLDASCTSLVGRATRHLVRGGSNSNALVCELIEVLKEAGNLDSEAVSLVSAYRLKTPETQLSGSSMNDPYAKLLVRRVLESDTVSLESHPTQETDENLRT